MWVALRAGSTPALPAKNMNTIQQLTLFEEGPAKRPGGRKKSATYEEFVAKFEPKKTTDDCYTPAPVYDAVLGWVRDNCDIEGCNIVRPFYPGGDYEAVEYGPNDVVVDNPPFSIVTKIVRYYMAQGVRFFLFAPHLTLFQPGRHCTSVVAFADIAYENGARVKTAFVSNMLGDICVMSAPELHDAIEAAQAQNKAPQLPKYIYPLNVLKSTDLERFAKHGIHFAVRKDEAHYVTRLDSQGSKAIFGGGYLISERAAAGRAAAERAAAERAIKITEWTLSEREWEIIKDLSK